MFIDIDRTLWSGNSPFNAKAGALDSLIPAMGEIPEKNKNPALEDFRKLSNAYYRFYNDGDSFGKLWQMFRKYGVERPDDFGYHREQVLRSSSGSEYLERLAEAVIDPAFKEQNLEIAPDPEEIVVD